MEDAEELLQLQLRNRAGSGSTPSNISQEEKEKLLQENALQVERAIECFDTVICSRIDQCMESNHKPLTERYANEVPVKYTHYLGHGPHLFPSERARFTRLYYRMWILAVASPEERAARLQKTELRELYRLVDMLSWARCMVCAKDYDYINMHTALREGGFSKQVRDSAEALDKHHRQLEWNPGSPLPENAVFNVWAVFDHCQSILSSIPEGLTMAALGLDSVPESPEAAALEPDGRRSRRSKCTIT